MNIKRTLALMAAVVIAIGCGTKPSAVGPLAVEVPVPTAPGPTLTVAKNPGTKREPAPGPLTDEALLEKVSQRLLTVMDPLPAFVKPPTFEIVNDDKINAYAKAEIEGKAPDIKVLPRVVVFSGLMKRVIKGPEDGAEDRLAFIVSHELGHVLLAHIVRRPTGDTAFVQQVFSRDQESQADLKGMEMALKAGFSFKQGRGAISRMKEQGLNYSSFEGLGVDHPSWNDRLALMDKEQPLLWKAMSAFQEGTFFLLFEQYAAAERCFQQVTREFPECHEAWNNLGYTQLMQYCDGLETEDLRQLGIGQVVIGGFYTRPKSLETLVRGQDEKLWKSAVEALQQALKLKPDLTLAKANLGVAFLVAPQGKDVPRARQYFQEAVNQLPADKDLAPLARIAILINAGVADLAAGKDKECAGQFAKAQEAARRFSADLPRASATFALYCALCYNRALLAAASPEEARRRAAVAEFEQYLKLASPGSAWWPLAYEQYAKLCKDLDIKAKEKTQLVSPTQALLRLVTSVKLKHDVTVTLNEPLADVMTHLGEGRPIPIVRGTKLVRLAYPDHGIELLAADRVLAIRLRGPKAPEVGLQGVGLGGGSKTLRLGMTQEELAGVLKEQPFELRQLDKPDLEYRFYPQLGLAVRADEGKLQELVIAQIPRQPVGGQ
jgi:tetratricopeptide (TPR) repeat protein